MAEDIFSGHDVFAANARTDGEIAGQDAQPCFEDGVHCGAASGAVRDGAGAAGVVGGGGCGNGGAGVVAALESERPGERLLCSSNASSGGLVF